MLDEPMPREAQLSRFGFCFDDCGGFGDYHDFHSFAAKTVELAPEGATIVEVGSFKGRSGICLGLYAKEANKGLKIILVDDGSQGANPELKENIKKSGLSGFITLIEKPNVEAAKDFSDGSVWLAMLDDDHRHDQVEQGIRAWMPKISKDGWLVGHDALWHSVAEPVIAIFGRENLIRSDWRDIWIIRKQTPRENVDIHGYTSLTEMVPGSWEKMVKESRVS